MPPPRIQCNRTEDPLRHRNRKKRFGRSRTGESKRSNGSSINSATTNGDYWLPPRREGRPGTALARLEKQLATLDGEITQLELELLKLVAEHDRLEKKLKAGPPPVSKSQLRNSSPRTPR